MDPLRFEVIPFEYSRHPAFGGRNIVSRLTPEFCREHSYPVLDSPHSGHQSDSPWMRPEEARKIVNSLNPALPPLAAPVRFLVSGQQAGLLTGPMFSVLKAISLINLACEINKGNSGAQMAPLFWVASEDHDLPEVNHVTLRGKTFTAPTDFPLIHNEIPQVADVPLSQARQPLLTFLEQTLPTTEFKTWVLEVIESADFSNYQTAFVSLFHLLFRECDLRLVDPISLRCLTTPVLAEAVARWPDIEQAFARGAQQVRTAGFAPPLESPAFFELVGGKRRRVEIKGEKVYLASGAKDFVSAAEEMRGRPESFSPGAALRPLLQDAVLPVTAYLGGPAEMLYLWQIDPMYEVLGIRRSLLWPRISATLVESKIKRIAIKTGLWPKGIFEAGKAAEAPPPGIALEGAAAQVEEKSQALLAALDSLAAGQSAPWVLKSRERIAGATEKMLHQLREEAAREQGLGRDRLKRIAAALMPGGQAQERSTNIFHWMALYGPELLRGLVASLDPLARSHQIAVITAGREEESSDGS